MKDLLESLENCNEISELKPVLHALCTRFGSISRLDVLPASQAGRRQALCFLRMQSAEEEETLVRELGIGRFGGALVVVVDLLPRKTGVPTVLRSATATDLHSQRSAA